MLEKLNQESDEKEHFLCFLFPSSFFGFAWLCLALLGKIPFYDWVIMALRGLESLFYKFFYHLAYIRSFFASIEGFDLPLWGLFSMLLFFTFSWLSFFSLFGSLFWPLSVLFLSLVVYSFPVKTHICAMDAFDDVRISTFYAFVFFISPFPFVCSFLKKVAK